MWRVEDLGKRWGRRCMSAGMMLHPVVYKKS